MDHAADQVNQQRLINMDRWNAKHHTERQNLKVGDMVLLWDYTLEKQWSRKFDDRWLGPYVIWKTGDGNTAWLAELDGAKFAEPVTMARLKPFRARNESLQQFEKTFQKTAAGLSGVQGAHATMLHVHALGGPCEMECGPSLQKAAQWISQSRWSGICGLGRADVFDLV